MTQQSPGGASLQLQAIEILASTTALERVREQIFDVLCRNMPISVTVQGLGDLRHAETVFCRVCDILRSVADEAGADPTNVSIAIDAGLLSPQFLWTRREEVLGPGPLYLLVGSALTRPSTDIDERRRQDQFWLQCWHLRVCPHVRTAFAPMVSSPCPLLPSEVATGVLPPFGLQVPPGSAWVPMQIDVTDYANERGDLSVFALRECLRRSVDYGESMLDETDWPSAAMRHDAWANRRLAISVVGVGDLAKKRGLDPQCFYALKDLGAVLQEVRDAVNNYSRQLATEIEPAPSLHISDSQLQTDWQARWQTALRFAAIRHRNLLAMSPWSLFPSDSAADCRYCDLLPLMAHADVCLFPEPPCLKAWNINEFKHFHHRAWAVLEQKDAQQLFAEQV